MKKVAVLFLIIFSCQCSADWCWVICCTPLFKRLSTWCSSCRTSTEPPSGSWGINCDGFTYSNRDDSTYGNRRIVQILPVAQQSTSSPEAQQRDRSDTAQQRVNLHCSIQEDLSQLSQQCITQHQSRSGSSRINLSANFLVNRIHQNQPHRQGYSCEDLLHSCENLISGSNQVGSSGFYQSSRHGRSYDCLEYQPTHPCHSYHDLRRQQTRTRSASHLNNQQLRAKSSSYRRMETRV